MTCSRKVWVGAIVTAFIATTATAGPPTYSNQNRTYGSWVVGASCTPLPNGYRCREIQVSENYDVKGTYEFTEGMLHAWSYQEDPEAGSWEHGERFLTCPIDQKSISAHPNRVAVDFMLDTEALGCNNWGYLDTYDPDNGYQSQPLLFPSGQRAIAGEWMDPFSYDNSTSNNKGSFHNGWSNMTSSYVNHCKNTWGDLMTRGGFSINTRFYAFEGTEGSTWSAYWISSCNENNKEQ